MEKTPEVHIIKNSVDAGNVLTKLRNLLKHFPLAVDTETTGLDPFNSKLLLIQLGTPSNQFVIPWNLIESDKFVLKQLKFLLEDEDQPLLLHNAKFDYKMIKYHANIEMNNMRDTMIAAHLIRTGQKKSGFGLANLLSNYGIANLTKSTREKFIDKENYKFSKEELEYAARDVQYLHSLYNVLIKEIQDLGLESVYNLECSAIPVTGDLELNGIYLDYNTWISLEAVTREARNEARKRLDTFFEKYVEKDIFGNLLINYSSPAQIKPIIEKIIGEGIPGTGKAELEKIYHPVAKAMLDYRVADKRVAAFGENFYLKYVNKKTGRIHANFHQTGTTDTGRYSSSDPNMQQIPRDVRYRAAFRAEDGWKIVGADYSSMELVLLAEFSGDEGFMNIFIKGVDAHCHVGSMLMNKVIRKKGTKYFDVNGEVKVADEDINLELRQVGKSINFGTAYGLGPSALARDLKIEYREAKNLLDKFWKTFPKIKQFLDERVQEALDNQCVTSYMDGRIRWLNGPDLRIPSYRAHASNIAKNMSLQSGNATITKKALIMLKERIKDLNWDKSMLPVLTIHDEIVCEVKEDIAKEAKNLLSKTMIDAAKIWVHKVPVRADAYVADHWQK